MKLLKSQETVTNFIIILAFGLGFGLWLVAMVLGDVHYEHDTDEKMARLGQFGDSFGWLNCLFSAFAMTGAITTLFLQTQWQKREERKERISNAAARHRHKEQLAHTNCEFQLHKLEVLMLNFADMKQMQLDFLSDVALRANGSMRQKVLKEVGSQIVLFKAKLANVASRGAAVILINFQDMEEASNFVVQSVLEMGKEYMALENPTLEEFATVFDQILVGIKELESKIEIKAKQLHSIMKLKPEVPLPDEDS